MPHPVARPYPPGKGKLSDRQEQRQCLEEENHEKSLPDENTRLDTLHAEGATSEEDTLSETLSNGLSPDAQKLGSYAGLAFDDIEGFADDPWQVHPQWHEMPGPILFGNRGRPRGDAEVEAVRELIRQAEAVGLIGEGALPGEDEEVPVDFDGRSILDRSDALWDRIVLGSVPFDFGDGASEKAMRQRRKGRMRNAIEREPWTWQKAWYLKRLS